MAGPPVDEASSWAGDGSEGGSIRVTLKDVYIDVLQMKRILQTLSDKLPSHIQQTEDDLADIRKDVQDHERRLRSIETKMWGAVGGFGLLAAVSPYISALFNK